MRRQRLTVRRRSRRRRVWVAATIMGGMRCVIGVITWPRRRQRLRRRPAAWLPRPAVALRRPRRKLRRLRPRLVLNYEETFKCGEGRPCSAWAPFRIPVYNLFDPTAVAPQLSPDEAPVLKASPAGAARRTR